MRDIVDSAVCALSATDGRFDGKSFVLTGPRAIGFAEIAAAIGKAIGRDVKYVPVPHEAAKQSMLGMGVPEWVVDGFIELAVGFADNFANMTTDGVKTLAADREAKLTEVAVSMAIACPALLRSGPPESPGCTAASVSMSPCSRSALPPPGSLAVIDRCRAVILPIASLGVPPAPPALPIAVTLAPTRSMDESPSGTV